MDMIRKAIGPKTSLAACVLAAGSLVALAAPASAADGPPEVGCTTGSSCMVQLNYAVTYTGSTGGSNGVVVTPPPCIGVAIGDAHTGSEEIMSLYGDTAPVATPSPSISPTTAAATPAASSASPSPSSLYTATPTPSMSPTATQAPADEAATLMGAQPQAASSQHLTPAQQQQLDQARQLDASNPPTPGEWYQITGDPAATAAAQQKCASLPLFVWVPGGSNLLRVDGVDVPPRTLAELAYSQINTAPLGQVTLNPAAQSDTNLPTFVDVTMLQPKRGVLSVSDKGVPYVWATAATPDGEAATVWAYATQLSITPGSPNATTYDQQRCTTAHLGSDDRTFILGSRYTKSEMAKVGANTAIDCGVTYTSPGKFQLTASVTWNACWTQGVVTAGGPPANCQPVPGAGGLNPSVSKPVTVNVRDIQADNG